MVRLVVLLSVLSAEAALSVAERTRMGSMRSGPGSRRPFGVRSQTTAVAAVVVGAALLLGGLALVLLLQRSLTSSLEASLGARLAQEVVTVSEDGPDGLASNELGPGDGVLVQVLDAGGGVVFTSAPSRTVAVSSTRPAPGQLDTSGRTLLPRPGDLALPLTVAQGVEHAGQPYVVLVSATQDAQQEAVVTTGTLLLVGVPLLMALTGLVTWWLVGRALRSVELIRTQVERIGASRLGERVPVPGSRDEIAHLASTMNAMLTRLETSQSTQRRFVADASHELRSPLATLAAALEVGQVDQSEQTWRDLMPILEAETQRMRHLVDDLLLLSKVDDRGLPVSRADVDLDDLVDQESRRLRGLGQVRVTTRAAPTRVTGDEHKLAQMIRNLADNAARAARAEVRLSVHADGEAAVITVEDDGPGIPVRDRHRVFERFVRLDESRSRQSGGSGLGLSIAHEIVRGHGGVLTVGESDLGGARLTARLPLPAGPRSADGESGQTRE